MQLDIDASKLRSITVPDTGNKPPLKIRRTNAMRGAVKNALRKIKFLSRSARIFMFELTLIEGIEKHSGQPVKTLYLGEIWPSGFTPGKLYLKDESLERYANFKFIVDSVYSDYRIITNVKNVFGLHINRELNKYMGRTDLIFIDTEILFAHGLDKSQCLVIPPWVLLRLNLSDKWEDIFSAFSRNLRKRIRRVLSQGYQYITTHNQNHINYFYHEMYVPYTKARFGDAAFVYPEEIYRKIIEQGEILFLFRDGRLLLGSLNKFEEDRLLLICAAAASDFPTAKFKGASDAMDYFCFLSAYEKGYRVVDFLGSRPLLEDGAFRYKQKWGTHIDKFHRPLNDLYCKVLNLNNGVKAFLTNNPFIIKTQNSYRGRILIDTLVNIEEIQNCIKRYQTPGLEGIDIFCTAGIQEGIDETLNHSSEIKIYDISDSKHPEKDFCSL